MEDFELQDEVRQKIASEGLDAFKERISSIIDKVNSDESSYVASDPYHSNVAGVGDLDGYMMVLVRPLDLEEIYIYQEFLRYSFRENYNGGLYQSDYESESKMINFHINKEGEADFVSNLYEKILSKDSEFIEKNVKDLFTDWNREYQQILDHEDLLNNIATESEWNLIEANILSDRSSEIVSKLREKVQDDYDFAQSFHQIMQNSNLFTLMFSNEHSSNQLIEGILSEEGESSIYYQMEQLTRFSDEFIEGNVNKLMKDKEYFNNVVLSFSPNQVTNFEKGDVVSHNFRYRSYFDGDADSFKKYENSINNGGYSFFSERSSTPDEFAEIYLFSQLLAKQLNYDVSLGRGKDFKYLMNVAEEEIFQHHNYDPSLSLYYSQLLSEKEIENLDDKSKLLLLDNIEKLYESRDVSYLGLRDPFYPDRLIESLDLEDFDSQIKYQQLFSLENKYRSYDKEDLKFSKILDSYNLKLPESVTSYPLARISLNSYFSAVIEENVNALWVSLLDENKLDFYLHHKILGTGTGIDSLSLVERIFIPTDGKEVDRDIVYFPLVALAMLTEDNLNLLKSDNDARTTEYANLIFEEPAYILGTSEIFTEKNAEDKYNNRNYEYQFRYISEIQENFNYSVRALHDIYEMNLKSHLSFDFHYDSKNLFVGLVSLANHKGVDWKGFESYKDWNEFLNSSIKDMQSRYPDLTGEELFSLSHIFREIDNYFPVLSQNERYSQAMKIYEVAEEQRLFYSDIEVNVNTFVDGILPPKDFVEDEREIIRRTLDSAKNHPEHGDIIQKILDSAEDALQNLDDSRKTSDLRDLTKDFIDVYIDETNKFKGYEGEMAIQPILAFSFQDKSEEHLAHYSPSEHHIVFNNEFYNYTKTRKRSYNMQVEDNGEFVAPLLYIGTLFHEMSHIRQVHYHHKHGEFHDDKEEYLAEFFYNSSILSHKSGKWSFSPKELSSEISSEIATDFLIYHNANFIEKELKSMQYDYTNKLGRHHKFDNILSAYDSSEGLGYRFSDNFADMIKFDYGVDAQISKSFLRDKGLEFKSKDSSIKK